MVADAYDAVEKLGAERFDLVFTGIGALCWLPDIGRWAQVVATLLRPGGRLFIREGHPMMWTLSDPRPDGQLVVEYPYFESPGIVFTESESYAQPARSPRRTRSASTMGWARSSRHCATPASS